MDENGFLIDTIQHTVSNLIMIFKYIKCIQTHIASTQKKIKTKLKSSKIMLIKNKENFSINKLMLLFNIAWLLQLKKIPNNQLKMNENVLNEESKNGLVRVI